MKKFVWEDAFLLEAQLSDDERLLRDAAAGFAREVLQPRVVADFRDNHSDDADAEVLRGMGERGLLGMTIAQDFGGAGANYVSYGLAQREIERVDSGYRTMMSVQSSLTMFPIAAYGSDEQKKKFLPRLATGELIGCFGLTEANAGSDPASLTTRATRTSDGYCINGSKAWISNSPIADVFIIWAKSEAHHNEVRGFVLEKGMKGLSAPRIAGKQSLRTAATGEVVMDNVRVSEDALLPATSGLKSAFNCLNRARFGIAWGVLGAAEFCWLAAREYGLSRQQFGRAIAGTQLFQKKLADMQTDIALGLQGCLRVGRLMDEGQFAPEMISLLKRNHCKKALGIARMAREMHGANGIDEAYGVMRHAINLETVSTYEGTEDMHALILGRAQTGLSAF